MGDAAFNNPTPQFGTAEYVGTPGNDHCQFCHQPVAGTYYRVNDAMSCPACADKVRGELAKDTHSAFVKGILFGIGAAIVGMILYATFAITTGIIIGYVSLAVGWMVGKAIIKGSGGVGGRRYQIAAAVLTYAAVAMAAVPIWIHYARAEKQSGHQHQTATQQQSENDFNRQEHAANRQSGDSQSSDSQSGDSHSADLQSGNSQSAGSRPSPATFVAKLALLGIASPIIEVWEGGPSFGWAIGIVILIVGIRIAWRLTAGRPLQIYGPFENSQPAR
jgi:hypothetical protein